MRAELSNNLSATVTRSHEEKGDEYCKSLDKGIGVNNTTLVFFMKPKCISRSFSRLRASAAGCHFSLLRLLSFLFGRV